MGWNTNEGYVRSLINGLILILMPIPGPDKRQWFRQTDEPFTFCVNKRKIHYVSARPNKLFASPIIMRLINNVEELFDVLSAMLQ